MIFPSSFDADVEIGCQHHSCHNRKDTTDARKCSELDGKLENTRNASCQICTPISESHQESSIEPAKTELGADLDPDPGQLSPGKTAEATRNLD